MKKLAVIPVVFFSMALSFLSGAKQPHFEREIVDSQGPPDPWAKILSDIDGDGYLDVAIGGRKGPLVWYRFPTWAKSLIATGGYDTVDGEAGDIDKDGDPDLVLGGLLWYENPGPEGLGASEWEAHRIADHATHDIELADLDQDGDLDIVTRDQSAFGDPRGHEIHLWIQEDGGWNHLQLTCREGEGIRVADLDDDGDHDIVINGFWFENTGSVTEASSWVGHEITDWHHSSSVAVGDINDDGLRDVILVPSELRGETFKIAWYEAVDARGGIWIEHVVEPQVETVYHSLQVADMDGDGLLDVITAEMHQGADPDEVMIYLNQKGGESWSRQVLSTRGSHGIQVGDIDGDGRLDVMGANWSGSYQPIELWLNR
jgi:hypothetical protein